MYFSLLTITPDQQLLSIAPDCCFLNCSEKLSIQTSSTFLAQALLGLGRTCLIVVFFRQIDKNLQKINAKWRVACCLCSRAGELLLRVVSFHILKLSYSFFKCKQWRSEFLITIMFCSDFFLQYQYIDLLTSFRADSDEVSRCQNLLNTKSQFKILIFLTFLTKSNISVSFFAKFVLH